MPRRPVLLALAALAAIAITAWLLLPPDAAAPAAPAAGSSAAPAPQTTAPQAPALATLRGRVVTGPDDAPVADAIVTIAADASAAPTVVNHAPSRQHARSDADGRFTLELRAGRYTLRAAARGHAQTATTRLELPADGAEVVLRLRATASGLRGEVADIESGPIEGAEVQAAPLGARALAPSSTFTGADGAYTLDLVDGTYEVVVHHDSYAEARQLVVVRDGHRRADFRLLPAGSIAGVVRRARDGAAVAGACVLLAREASGGLTPEAAPTCARTDEAGAFVVEGVAPGDVALTAHAPALGLGAPHALTVGIGEAVTGVELVLDDAGDAAARVTWRHDGAPAAGVAVVALRAADEGRLAARALTGADGVATLPGLVAGRYVVRTEPAPGALTPAAAALDVPADAPPDRVELALDRGATVSGRVSPPQPARVWLRASAASIAMDMLGAALTAEGTLSVDAGDDGAFALAGVPPGAWELVATTAHAEGATAVTVATADVTDVVVALDALATLCGHVVDSTGAPVTDVAVTTVAPGQQMSFTAIAFRMARHALAADLVPVDDRGAFCLRGLRPGSHNVLARSATSLLDWGPRHTRDGNLVPVELAAGERRDGFTLEVKRPTAAVAGRVVDDRGAPIAGAIVRLTDRLDNKSARGTAFPALTAFVPPPPVIADDAGAFRVSGLDDGRYQLEATAPGDARAAAVQAEADTGAATVVTIPRAGAIRGELTTDGAGVCRVRLLGARRQTTSGHGPRCAFTFDRVAPGVHAIVATRADTAARASVTVVAGETADVSLTPAPPPRVRARFTDASGAPVAGLVLLVISAETADAEAAALEWLAGVAPRSDADGRITVLATPGLAVALALTSDGQRSVWQQSIMVPAGGLDLGEVEVKR